MKRKYVLLAPSLCSDLEVYGLTNQKEWFYQVKGDMVLRVIEDNAFKDIHIKEGEMFLLPGTYFPFTLSSVQAKPTKLGNTPHGPIRYADTIGLVMERKRPGGSLDRLRWYCEKGDHRDPTLIREEVFHCQDLGEQLKAISEGWRNNESLRKCGVCGVVADPE